jgi:hypothetical protein
LARLLRAAFLTRWGKLAACGYWLDPKQGFA